MYLQVSPSPCRALKWKPQTPNTEHKLYELLCAAAEQLRGSKRVPFSVECTVTEASQVRGILLPKHCQPSGHSLPPPPNGAPQSVRGVSGQQNGCFMERVWLGAGGVKQVVGCAMYKRCHQEELLRMQAKDSSGKDKQVLTQIQFSEKPDLIFLILGSAGQASSILARPKEGTLLKYLQCGIFWPPSLPH